MVCCGRGLSPMLNRVVSRDWRLRPTTLEGAFCNEHVFEANCVLGCSPAAPNKTDWRGRWPEPPSDRACVRERDRQLLRAWARDSRAGAPQRARLRASEQASFQASAAARVRGPGPHTGRETERASPKDVGCRASELPGKRGCESERARP